jgi:DNA-binding transcriptional ArsR family regulator
MTTDQAAQAVAHPLRARLLDRLDGAVASPSDLATEFGEPIGNVSYHVRILAKAGAIHQVDARPVRGAIEHFYTAAYRIRLVVKAIPVES